MLKAISSFRDRLINTSKRNALIFCIALGVGVIGIAAALSPKNSGNSTSDAKATQSQPSSLVPDGYQQYSDKVDGFKIAAPTSWVSINISDPQVSKDLDQVLAANPKLQAISGSGPTLNKNVKFATYTAADGSSLNVVVWSNSAFSTTSTDDLKTALKSEIVKAGGKVTSAGTTTFAGQEAIKLNVTLHINGAASSYSGIVTQYFVVQGDTAYVVSLTGTNSELQTIANTFQFT
jgi:hypothetical protein